MICETCEGSGFIKDLEYCPECQGEGYVEDPSINTQYLAVKDVIDTYGHLLTKEEVDRLYKLL
jgi:DnaJ-class molecular chaperone